MNFMQIKPAIKSCCECQHTRSILSNKRRSI